MCLTVLVRIQGCNCDNCAMNAVLSSDLGSSSDQTSNCNVDYRCQCSTGKRSTRLYGADHANYIALTVSGVRKLISTRFCVPGQWVSWEFVQHLESIGDSNVDGTIDAVEFDLARDPLRVLLEPGCVMQAGLRKLFPNMGLMNAPGCNTGHRHRTLEAVTK
jgi:hypothetical protein